MSTRRIHLLYTGGTIGQVDSPDGLVPGPAADIRAWAERALGEAGIDADVSFSAMDLPIDSVNATPEQWQEIADAVRALPAGLAGCVVLHGTDTMAYTSSVLSLVLGGIGFPVVLTGSQLPYHRAGSDAAGNVAGAVRCVLDRPWSGVGLFFGDSLFPGDHVTKRSSFAFDAFESPLAGPWARVEGTVVNWLLPIDEGGAAAPGEPVKLGRPDIAVIDFAPGMTAARLRSALTPLPDAVVLRGYGAGNGPGDEPGFTDVVRFAVDGGCVVVMASQVREARIDMTLYRAGRQFADAGVIGAGTMTTEAAVARLVVSLSAGLRGEAVGREFALAVEAYPYG